VKALKADAMAVLFVNEAYKHCKALAATGEGIAMIPNHNGAARGPVKGGALEEGVVAGGDGDIARVAAELVKALARHRPGAAKRRASSCRPEGGRARRKSDARNAAF
jgi:catalase